MPEVHIQEDDLASMTPLVSGQKKDLFLLPQQVTRCQVARCQGDTAHHRPVYVHMHLVLGSYIYIYIYRVALGLHAKVPPYDWEHAGLDEIRSFLQEEIRCGRYQPTLGIPL